jgi:hypothetical protein
MDSVYERLLASLRFATDLLGSILLYVFCAAWILIAIWNIVEIWDPLVQQGVIEGEVDSRILFRVSAAMLYGAAVTGHGIIIYYTHKWDRQCWLDAKLR